MQVLLEQLLGLSPIWTTLLTILFFFLIAWIVHRLGGYFARRLIYLDRFTRRRSGLREERVQTLQGLLASTISFLAFTVAALFSLALFVTTDTIIWMVGLFSAAFGLGARPLISDYLTGISFIFEDTFDIGEKIELAGLNVQGIIEAVNAIPFNFTDNGLSAARRVHLAILMVMTTPDYLVQR